MNRLLLCCAAIALSFMAHSTFTPEVEACGNSTTIVKKTHAREVQLMKTHLSLAKYDKVMEEGCRRFRVLPHYSADGTQQRKYPRRRHISYSSSAYCLLNIDAAFLSTIKVNHDAHKEASPQRLTQTLALYTFESTAGKMTQLERKRVALAVVAEVRKQRTTFDTLTDTQKKALAPRRAHLAHVMKSLAPYLKRDQEMVAEVLAWDLEPEHQAEALTLLDALHTKKRLNTPDGMLLYAKLTSDPIQAKHYAKQGEVALARQTKQAERKLKAHTRSVLLLRLSRTQQSSPRTLRH